MSNYDFDEIITYSAFVSRCSTNGSRVSADDNDSRRFVVVDVYFKFHYEIKRYGNNVVLTRGQKS